MPYNPSSDLVGLWRAISGGVEKAEMPGLDFVVAAMSRAGLMRTVTSQTAPTVNQSTTAWFKPAAQSFASEGTLFLWDPSLNMYVPATPELFHGGSSGGGGDGGGTDMVIISGTAPSNPSAGTEWWNGTVLQVWDGGMWKTIGPGGGAVTTTTMTFQIVQASTPAFTAASWVVAPWTVAPNILTDGAGAWDAINHKYTPIKAGYYLSSFWSNYNMTGAGTSGRAIQQNDDASTMNHTFSIASVTTAAAQAGWLAGTDIVKMNGTTDYLRLWVFDTFGGAGTGAINWHATLLP